MVKRTLAILVVAILALGFESKKEPSPEPPPDSGNLEGTWELQSRETTAGTKYQMTYTMKVTVDKKSWTQTMIYGKAARNPAPITYTVETNDKKKPAWIDLTQPNSRIAMRAIYEVKGDTMKLCYTTSASPTVRPSSFTDKSRTYYILT